MRAYVRVVTDNIFMLLRRARRAPSKHVYYLRQMVYELVLNLEYLERMLKRARPWGSAITPEGVQLVYEHLKYALSTRDLSKIRNALNTMLRYLDGWLTLDELKTEDQR